MDKALWIVCLLHQHGPLSRNEILEAWCENDKEGKPMAQSTFYDNRRYIKQRYGLQVVLSHGLYSIQPDGDEEKDIISLLQQTTEDNTESPNLRNQHWMPVLKEAIATGNQVRMTYAPLDKAAYETVLSPYCLRQFRRNGYCVGFSEYHKDIRTFAVDRINALMVLPHHYKLPADFRESDYFRHSFGVFGGKDISPEKIVIEVNVPTAIYLRTRPLHRSQKEIGSPDPQTVRFALCLATTKDFVAELLSYGPNIKVITPAHLKETLSKQHALAAEAYQEE